MTRRFDPIELEVLWQSLIATVNEQAKALQRAAFSPIVREAGDLANAVFDRRARMVAQAVTGTPGHINSLALGAAAILEEYPPDSLVPGDVLITNDPYKTAGQLLDVTVLVPVFKGERVIAFFGSTIHHTDVGGYGIGAGGRDVFEEGLWIPICKLHVAGQRNPDVWKFILSNVRQPDHMAGDLHAQMASGEVGAQRLLALCEQHGLDDIEDLADEIISRSEEATRASIRTLPGGTYRSHALLDLADGSRIDINVALTIDPEAGEVLVDYAGSSPASPYGINVVKNYTHAYTTFAVRSVLNPEIPNNHGSLAPIKVEAPAGSIVNAVPPQPGTARHVVGMFLPNALLKALAQVKPAQAMAEGSGAVWTMQVNGHHDDGRPFITAMFTYAGGVGARAAKPGLSACSYPTGVAAVPVEVVEASAPIRFRCKQLRPGSGGAGAQPGGLGQTIEFTVDTTRPWQLNAVTSRLAVPPEGIFGGGPGAAGTFSINDQPVTTQARVTLQPDDVVRLELPGGGGYGAPAEDDAAAAATTSPEVMFAMSSVLTPELLASLDASMAPVEDALTLPPVLYTSDEFLDFERRALFSREWLCVGVASRIPNPGDFFTVRVNGEGVIVARGKDGDVRAFTSVCRHRGMEVANGAGTCSTFTCPYHHWVYGLDGRLLGAPAMERTHDFDKKQWGLPNLAVELWQGFVFVNMDPDAAPLAPTLNRYEPFLEHYDLPSCVCPGTFTLTDLPWNWKIMFENFNDGYHANRLHQVIQDFCPSNLAAFPVPWDDASNVVFRTNGYTHIDGGFNATTKALLPVFPELTEEERWRSTFALIPPTLCLGTAPDQAFFFIVTPRTAGTIDVEIGYLLHPSALEHPMFDHLFQMSDAGVQVFVRQDQDATTRVQRGMASRFAVRGRYSWQEESHVQLNRWLIQRYRRAWPGGDPVSATSGTASVAGPARAPAEP